MSKVIFCSRDWTQKLLSTCSNWKGSSNTFKLVTPLLLTPCFCLPCFPRSHHLKGIKKKYTIHLSNSLILWEMGGASQCPLNNEECQCCLRGREKVSALRKVTEFTKEFKCYSEDAGPGCIFHYRFPIILIPVYKFLRLTKRGMSYGCWCSAWIHL